ncbi:MAG: methyltransferase domain-containing protein [Fuerstiella sp.]|nr:methyltransferase domain-containing protein [Fuerstiella sp.]
MSQYANYALDSDSYDTTRIPIGVDTILASLDRTPIPLSQQVLLEAGCGTGNYLHALYPHVGSLAGIDFSEGMLTQARRKLGEQVGLSCGSILDMAFEGESFDGITCNQVIHHLEEGPSAADDPAAWKPCHFPNVTQFIQEAYRVLRPGGAFVINVTSHEQFRDGYWWADLIPVAVARLSCRMPDLDQLKQILTTAGFDIEAVSPDLDGILQGPSYLDPQGPLSEAWRAGDSTWSLTSDAELDDARQRVTRMNAEGTMQAYLDEREKKRLAIGQTTFFCGRK